MKSSLLFDFTVDKATSTVTVKKEFSAELPLVWDAFTRQEILDQWWGPKPWVSITKHMNFEVGGRRFYAMRSPQGEEHWSLQEYTAISPKRNFKTLCSFTDANENINPAFPKSDWHLDFNEAGGLTTATITIRHEKLEDLEKLIQMGFKEGFTMTLHQLDSLLSELSR
jgi:uncharacterized protein YndB with AHSA1/START domain